jgi:hypothetical protein
MQGNAAFAYWIHPICEQSASPLVEVNSKCQNTVETSTSGLEFCLMKTAINMINGFGYKLSLACRH